MTTETTFKGIPVWTLGDRLRKALQVADLQVQDIATVLGVTRQSVASWLSDRRCPSRATLVAWSLATGVDLVWLETGQEGTPPGTRTLNPLINMRRWAVAA